MATGPCPEPVGYHRHRAAQALARAGVLQRTAASGSGARGAGRGDGAVGCMPGRTAGGAAALRPRASDMSAAPLPRCGRGGCRASSAAGVRGAQRAGTHGSRGRWSRGRTTRSRLPRGCSRRQPHRGERSARNDARVGRRAHVILHSPRLPRSGRRAASSPVTVSRATSATEAVAGEAAAPSRVSGAASRSAAAQGSVFTCDPRFDLSSDGRR